MKYVTSLALCFCTMLMCIANGQSYTYNSEGFEAATWLTPSLSYTVTTGTWTTSSTLVSATSTGANTTNGGLKCLSIPSGQYLTSPTLTDGAASLTFYARSGSSSTRLLTIYTSTDGINFNSFATANSSSSSLSYALITVVINNSNIKNVRVSFPAAGGGAIDDFNISGMSGTQYYNSVGADVTNINNWWTNTDGLSGTHPLNFTSLGQTFNITHAGAIMNNPWAIASVVLSGSNTLSLNANTLTLNGTVAGTGTFSGTSASSIIINGAAGTLNFTVGSQTIKGCTLNSNATATLGTPLDITGGSAFGTLTLLSGAVLTTGNNLTLKSTAAGTARVGQCAGSISGKVIVERYIPANSNRAWRLLSVPVVSNQTLHSSLQEAQANGVPGVNNFGTNISSSRSTWNADGFDFASNSDGLLTWSGSLNNNAGNWVGVTSTNNLLSTDNGYMLYIRGDRNCTAVNNAITSTVIRMNGSLKLGNYPSTPIPVPAAQYAVVGNPYVSQIDFRSITKTAGIDNTFYLWDPKLPGSSGLGGFQTLLYDGVNYLISPGGGSYGQSNGGILNTIETGQAFFVHATTAGTLSFTEAAKTAGTNNVFLPATIHESLAVNLYSNVVSPTQLIDGTLVIYDNNSSDSVTSEDAGKMSNFGFNLSVRREGKDLAIERRQTISISDTIRLNMSGLIQQQYQLEIIATNLDHPALFSYLIDNYTHIITPLNSNGVTVLPFSSNADSASISPSRFKIIFSPIASLPISFLSISTETSGRGIGVRWVTTMDTRCDNFQVERSANGVTFVRQCTIAVTNSNTSYQWNDNYPLTGINFYRIKASYNNQQAVFSKIVNGATSGITKTISVKHFNTAPYMIIKLNMPPGFYRISIYNNLAQNIFHDNYKHQENDEIVLPTGHLPKGMYHIKVESNYGNSSVTIFL